jgi:hypothetical protein
MMILNGRNKRYTQDTPSSCVAATGRQVLTLRSGNDVQPFIFGTRYQKREVAMRMTGTSPDRCVKRIADRFGQLIFHRSTQSKMKVKQTLIQHFI